MHHVPAPGLGVAATSASISFLIILIANLFKNYNNEYINNNRVRSDSQ
jgi:hypothetical protein